MQKAFSFIKNLSLYIYVAGSVCIVLIISGVFYINHISNHHILLYMLCIGALPLWYELIQEMRKGSFGVDIIAGVAIIATGLTGQYLAGCVVLLMLSGGQILELFAMNRAKKELESLLNRTPEYVHIQKDGAIVDIRIEDVTVGMEIVIKPGEILAVDGTVIEGETYIDESVLTGESVPIIKQLHAHVFAGTQNKENMIIVRVDTPILETKYQAIIKLVNEAKESKAPIVRLANKYSVYFSIITFSIAGLTYFITGDMMRVVAILVVATPCPLILATPIAILSGISKASKRGIIIKDGGSLETLADIEHFVFDKTGTITLGEPVVAKVLSFSNKTEEEIVSLAASLDQLSTHILARALTKYAQEKKYPLVYIPSIREQFGDGVEGSIENVSYVFGKKGFAESYATQSTNGDIHTVYEKESDEGGMMVFLASKDAILGAVVFKDIIRNDAYTLFKKMRDHGVTHITLLTGDKKARAQDIAAQLAITDVISECLPEDKLQVIKQLQHGGKKVAMVGDGINDAPALVESSVGIALGSHGKTAASDVADIVILSQSINGVYDVWHIAKKTIGLAKNGIMIGIGLSIFLMVLSSVGLIKPVIGALMQEGIDIIVIINALRLGSILKKSFKV